MSRCDHGPQHSAGPDAVCTGALRRQHAPGTIDTSCVGRMSSGRSRALRSSEGIVCLQGDVGHGRPVRAADQQDGIGGGIEVADIHLEDSGGRQTIQLPDRAAGRRRSHGPRQAPTGIAVRAHVGLRSKDVLPPLHENVLQRRRGELSADCTGMAKTLQPKL